MTWMLIAVAVWTLLAALLAVLIGRMIRQADERESMAVGPVVPDFPPADLTNPRPVSHRSIGR